jgi:membrane associated rhomboid family serine protease
MHAYIVIIIITSWVSYHAWKDPSLMQKCIFNPYIINNKNEYWRFVTSGMIHKDMTHLLMNLFTLYFFGSNLEDIYVSLYGVVGSLYFVVIYFVTMILADIPSFFKHKEDFHYNALGASGAVSAMVFACIYFAPLNEICFYLFICLEGFIAGTLFIIYSIYQSKHGNDMIGHDVHMYGAILGFVSSLILQPELFPAFINSVLSYRLPFL